MNSEKLRSLAKELDKSVEKALRSQETLKNDGFKKFMKKKNEF